MRTRRVFMVEEEFKNSKPTSSMFRIVEEEIKPLHKDQFLVEAKFISVDPYMRSFASSNQVPYMQFGFQVGKVIESKHKDFPVGSNVVSHAGWCDLAVLDSNPDEMFGMSPYIAPVGRHSLSLAVGALGMPGMTAYLGFTEICTPRKGNIVCVTSACGAVGSLVGQIAKIKECIVIGFTGSDAKVKVLKELGFHHAFNYKTADVTSVLRQVAPAGIDIYFDNVGGTLSDKVMECMGNIGRIAICGAISTYEQERDMSLGRRSINSISRSAHIEAFSFTQWEWSKQRAALETLRGWLDSGAIKAKETIVCGFEKLPDAFISLLNGENIGKLVVKI